MSYKFGVLGILGKLGILPKLPKIPTLCITPSNVVDQYCKSSVKVCTTYRNNILTT